MTKDFLIEIGVPEEAITKIMAENGKDIEKVKSKFADYEDLKNQLQKANDKITSFGDVDAIKADVEKYKAEVEKAKHDSELKIAKMERQARIKELTSQKKFVNDFTRDSINSLLETELEKEESKGKSIDELFKMLTDGKENIFAEEKKAVPPTVPNMANDKTAEKDDIVVRSVMGLKPKN